MNLSLHNTAQAVPAIPVAQPDELSFVKLNKPRGTGYDYWCVKTTGDYAKDWQIGRAMGEEFAAFVGKQPTNGNTTLLGQIVYSMIAHAHEDRRARGAELSFLREVSNYAMLMAVMLKNPKRAEELIAEAGL